MVTASAFPAWGNPSKSRVQRDGTLASLCSRIAFFSERDSAPRARPFPSSQEPEQDAELFRVLTRAVDELGLEWSPPEEPSRSLLDEWFLPGCHQAPRQRASPFFPEGHEELTRSWCATYSACLRTSSFSALTSVDGDEDKGYEKLPPLDELVAAHLCPPTAIGWKIKASHPSKLCRTTSALAGHAYASAGQAASALHSMAVLQVFQAKLLAGVDNSALDSATLTELQSATDLALRATKATAQAIGRSMASLVVLERHLWLTLTEIKDADKVPFLDAPVSPTGLFGPTVEGFAERFSAAQKRSQAMRHFLPKCSSSAAASGRPKSAPPQQPVKPAPAAAAALAQPAKPEPRQRYGKRGRSRPTLRGDEFAGKGHCGSSSSSPERVRILQPLLPRPQEGWRPAAHPRSETLESGPHETAIQDDHIEADPLTHTPRGLVLFSGSEGCLLSHPVSPHHRRFLRFAFDRVAYQYTVLSFGLSLAWTRLFLRQRGIRVLNYLDNWLVLAQSEAELLSHRSLLLSHLECLGLKGGPGLCRSPDPLEELAMDGERRAPGYGLQEECGHDRCFQHSGGPSGVGSAQPLFTEGNARTRQTEPGCGYAITKQRPLWGVDVSSTGGPEDLGGLWQGGGRPIHLRRQLSLPNVLFEGQGCVGPRLAQPPPLCFSPNVLDSSSTQASQGTETQAPSGGPSLEKPALVLRAVPAACSSPLAHSPETRPPLSGERDNMAPPAQALGPAPLVSGRESMNLSESVLNTISQAKAPSTRRLYSLNWSVFSAWCSIHGEDPASCDISVILSFLQELLDKGCSPSTLKVYVAAIMASHAPIAGQALKGPLFEPLPGLDLRPLAFKAALLLALMSVKHMGDLQAPSVNPSCLEFGPGDSKIILKPRHGYVPKVPSTPFRAQ
ncbi:hypothetical protein M9458_055063, partial [Cirrhinus mrigala]